MNSKDPKGDLKKANQDFTNCISTEFLTKFLNGANVRVEDFCVKEREKMEDQEHVKRLAEANSMGAMAGGDDAGDAPKNEM